MTVQKKLQVLIKRACKTCVSGDGVKLEDNSKLKVQNVNVIPVIIILYPTKFLDPSRNFQHS